MQNANHKEGILIFLSCQAKTAGHKIVKILNMPKISLQVMQDSVKYILFLWIKVAVTGLQGSVKEHVRWGSSVSYSTHLF